MIAIIKRPTPHFNARPASALVSLVVLHADAGKSDAGTISWLASPDSKVSYHYLIGRTGVVYQFVADSQRAWHAGVSSFKRRPNCNDFSLGVSFANDQAGEPFTDAAIDAGVILVAELCSKHGIPIDRITTHAIVSPGRKTDPGPLFDMPAFLARVGAALP